MLGGELASLSGDEFKEPSAVHHVGEFDSYDEAYNAWKANAWATVDNAMVRYLILDA